MKKLCNTFSEKLNIGLGRYANQFKKISKEKVSEEIMEEILGDD